MKKIIYLLFPIILLIIIQKFSSIWLYLDNSWYPLNVTRYLDISTSFLYSIRTGVYLGYDTSTIMFSRYLGNFFLGLHFFSLVFLFCLTNFIFSYSILKEYFSKKSSIYGGVLYVVNPISLYFFNLTGFIFAYTSLTVVIYAVARIIQTRKIFYIIPLLIGGHFMISYTRSLGIFLLFLVLIGGFYYKSIFNFIRGNKFYTIFIFTVIITYFSPFIFSIIFPHINGQKEYFSGLANYAQTGSGWGTGLYFSLQTKSLLYNSIPREIIGNFGKEFQQSILFSLVSSLFIVVTIFLSYSFAQKDKNRTTLYFLSLLLLLIGIISAPKFIGVDSFIKLAYSYFPFIANNTYWLHLITIPLIVYLFSYVLNIIKIPKLYYFYLGLGGIYILVSLIPIINHQTNDKLGLISKNDIPFEIRETFHTEKVGKIPALFLPSSNIYVSWSKYPINMTNNNSYVEVLSSNNRVVNSKQGLLFTELKKDISLNYYIFNLKDIFIFSNLKNAEKNQFDFFPTTDFISQSKRILNKYSNSESHYVKKSNSGFTQFGIIGDSDYEYFLYSPQSIINSEIDTFFDEEIDINSRPVVIDSESFHKPDKIDNFEIPEENQNIKIDYKRSTKNPTKYFMKISNVDTSQDFLVQLNQTFGMSWKLKWVDKEEFYRYECIGKFDYFEITNNSFCYFEDGYLDSIGDYRYLNTPQVKDKNHFEGNFVGNTWLVESNDIRAEDVGKSELYAVVIYEKQFWYMLSLWISFGTLGLLILATIVQETYLYRKKKKGLKI